MKRILMMFTFLALCSSSLIFAQGLDDRQAPEQVAKKVTGAMTISNGIAAIKSDGITYLFPGLLRYAGFIEGLKEGAAVTVEGIARVNHRDAKSMIILTNKLTIGSKEYDLGMSNNAARIMQNRERPISPMPMPKIQGHPRGQAQNSCSECDNCKRNPGHRPHGRSRR
jgi:hypothetical protein